MVDRVQPDADAPHQWLRPLAVALFLAGCFYSLEHDWSYAGQGASDG